MLRNKNNHTSNTLHSIEEANRRGSVLDDLIRRQQRDILRDEDAFKQGQWLLERRNGLRSPTAGRAQTTASEERACQAQATQDLSPQREHRTSREPETWHHENEGDNGLSIGLAHETRIVTIFDTLYGKRLQQLHAAVGRHRVRSGVATWRATCRDDAQQCLINALQSESREERARHARVEARMDSALREREGALVREHQTKLAEVTRQLEVENHLALMTSQGAIEALQEQLELLRTEARWLRTSDSVYVARDNDVDQTRHIRHIENLQPARDRGVAPPAAWLAPGVGLCRPTLKSPEGKLLSR